MLTLLGQSQVTFIINNQGKVRDGLTRRGTTSGSAKEGTIGRHFRVMVPTDGRSSRRRRSLGFRRRTKQYHHRRRRRRPSDRQSGVPGSSMRGRPTDGKTGRQTDYRPLELGCRGGTAVLAAGQTCRRPPPAAAAPPLSEPAAVAVSLPTPGTSAPGGQPPTPQLGPGRRSRRLTRCEPRRAAGPAAAGRQSLHHTSAAATERNVPALARQPVISLKTRYSEPEVIAPHLLCHSGPVLTLAN